MIIDVHYILCYIVSLLLCARFTIHAPLAGNTFSLVYTDVKIYIYIKRKEKNIIVRFSFFQRRKKKREKLTERIMKRDKRSEIFNL